MANPRKFSEKIALHNQKQAEETAAFEQIMREVSDATAKVAPSSSSKHTLRINQSLGTFRGGSLPNVSAPADGVPITQGLDHKPDDNPLVQMGLNAALNNLEGMKAGLKQQQQQQQRESRGRSVGGGPIRSRPIERKMDTSPYSSGPYLSPPPDTSWRRTNSDSALHQSAMQGLVGDCSNLQRRQADSIGSRWSVTHRDANHENHDQRPRSSCDVPRVPGINIYPSAHEPGTIQIPIGNNTGSLPDLTNVHFPSPLNTPLDHELDQSSSPYSSSPVTASPTTLSPTSLPTRQPSARFQFSPGTPGARAPSPITSTHQNHLSVPVNSSYHHHNKGVTLDNSLSGLIDSTEFQQTHYALNNIANLYQQQCSPPSPTGRHSQQMGPNAGYRSPQTRPSPQSSPGVTVDGSRHSAPCSPSAPHSPLTSDNYILSQAQAALLQHFEQCSMMDNPVVTSDYNIETTTTNSQFTQANNDLNSIVANELANDAGYFSTSPSALAYPTAPTSLHTTPNTPTSIPNIILTDFSNAGDDFCRQELAKELGSAITGQLDSDLFPSDESLREGLGPLDLDGLQMLTDPELSVISDYTEDHFRQDRL